MTHHRLQRKWHVHFSTRYIVGVPIVFGRLDLMMRPRINASHFQPVQSYLLDQPDQLYHSRLRHLETDAQLTLDLEISSELHCNIKPFEVARSLSIKGNISFTG